ncbi:MAG: hypothetical protein HYT06_01515 [Candidatus Levybacteria bacterium]|nr:hypothetical protein [Candidatus Levybacteria bacterium]
MALTKSDLQQIGSVVDQKLNKRLNPVEKGIKALRKDVRYLKKTADLIAKNYDEGDVLLARRVKKIEEHLSLSSGN